jgi:hypothetical protein
MCNRKIIYIMEIILLLCLVNCSKKNPTAPENTITGVWNLSKVNIDGIVEKDVLSDVLIKLVINTDNSAELYWADYGEIKRIDNGSWIKTSNTIKFTVIKQGITAYFQATYTLNANYLIISPTTGERKCKFEYTR